MSVICICPIIDHEFHYNIVSESSCGSPSGSPDYFDNVTMKFLGNNRTDVEKVTSVSNFLLAE